MADDTNPGYLNRYGIPFEPDPMQPPLRHPRLPGINQGPDYPDPRLPLPIPPGLDRPPMHNPGPRDSRYEQIPVINPPFV